MLPLSMSEIFCNKGWIKSDYLSKMNSILYKADSLSEIETPSPLTLTKEMLKEINLFLFYGGLPLSYLQNVEQDKLAEIRLTVERGFDVFTKGSRSLSEIVKFELAY